MKILGRALPNLSGNSRHVADKLTAKRKLPKQYAGDAPYDVYMLLQNK